MASASIAVFEFGAEGSSGQLIDGEDGLMMLYEDRNLVC